MTGQRTREHFTGVPTKSLTKRKLGKLSLSKLVSAVLICYSVFAVPSNAQTFTTLVTFDGTDGATPLFGPLVQGANGNFYGTTYGGTIFEITSAGQVTTLYTFCSQAGCTDGEQPYAGLVLATNGNFYGTTSHGGAYGGGTVFELTPSGQLTTLYSFCAQALCADGGDSEAGLVQATNGNFYGTTFGGGSGDLGTVFEITASGKLTTLHDFNGTDGYGPRAGLVQAANGNFYGTTLFGGTGGKGTLFEITAAGKLTTLHNFAGPPTDGSTPYAGSLVQAKDGNLYGTTASGGAGGNGGSGTIFKITPAGALTVLYSFCIQVNCADGAGPEGGLVQAINGNFLGTTSGGGADTCGTLFELNAEDQLTTLHSFDWTDGCQPATGLLSATNGNFYGTTSESASSSACGTLGCGTVFSLGIGLGRFVETKPTSGRVGASVVILGNGLTGTTTVSFNGSAAAFTVVSSTEITATVPAGATSGTVVVTTPKKTLKSNVKFHVTP